MSRPRTGSLIYDQGTGVYAIRYTVSGPQYRKSWHKRWYERLGSDRDYDSWTRPRAEQELQDRLTLIRLGKLTPPQPPPEVELVEEDPMLTVFAREWMHEHRDGVEPRSVEFREWAVEGHLLPSLGNYRLSEFSPKLIDRYRAAKLREGVLSARSINATLRILSQLLEDAVEDEALPLTTNPARGKRRRLKAAKPRRTWLALDEVRSLLDAAKGGRAMIGMMVLAGTRVSETCAVRWGAVDLTCGRLTIVESKTERAGERSTLRRRC